MVVGCGSQLTLKLVRDVIERDLLAISNSLSNHVSAIGDCFFMENPIESRFVVLIDDLAAERNLSSVLKSSSLIICCNRTAQQKYVKMFGEFGYSASASIDAYHDLKSKITKGLQINGLRFIEVLAPCPHEWGYDTSLTVHISRDAVESGIWPLFEMEGRKVVLGKRPEKLGILEPFHNIQNKYRLDKESVEAGWKDLVSLSLR